MRSARAEGAAAGTSTEERSPLLDAVERRARLGRWDWCAHTGELRFSESLYRLLGLEPGAVAPTPELVLALLAPGERERVVGAVASMRETGALAQLEFRITPPGARALHLLGTVVAIEPCASAPRRIAGFVQDVTEERIAQQEIAVHLAVSDVVRGWENVEVSGMGLLAGIGDAMGFDFAALWLPEADRLGLRLSWSSPALELAPELEAESRSLRPPRSVDLPGIAWQRMQIVSSADVAAGACFARRPAVTRAGLDGALAFPAIYAGSALAVLEFLYHGPGRPAARLLRTFDAVAHQIGGALAATTGEVRPPILTRRERQILQLAADGYSAPEMADRLVLGVTTVRTHMKHIFARLGVDDRAAAVASGMRLGLIE